MMRFSFITSSTQTMRDDSFYSSAKKSMAVFFLLLFFQEIHSLRALNNSLHIIPLHELCFSHNNYMTYNTSH